MDSFEDDAALVQSLEGHTVVRAVWEDRAPGERWTEHECARLELDDGRIIEFGGYGFDNWGATVRLVEEDEDNN